MLQLINHQNRHRYHHSLEVMHADRKRVFIDLLKWDLPHDGSTEHDQFDDADAEYLILQDRVTGDHLASMRLLRTERPHLLDTVFPFLCERPIPRGPRIREITRFCLSPRLRARQRLEARNRLVRGMIEYGLLTGIETFTAVCEIRFLTQVLSAGWSCRPLGLPQSASGSNIGALRIDIGPETLSQMDASWRCETTVVEFGESNSSIAA